MNLANLKQVSELSTRIEAQSALLASLTRQDMSMAITVNAQRIQPRGITESLHAAAAKAMVDQCCRDINTTLRGLRDLGVNVPDEAFNTDWDTAFDTYKMDTVFETLQPPPRGHLKGFL